MSETREVERRRYTENAGGLGWLPVWVIGFAFVIVVISGIHEEFTKNNVSAAKSVISASSGSVHK